MTSEERQDYILKRVKEQGTVKIIDLSKQLGVSRETIRKDIYDLAEKNVVRAIRGGATAPKLRLETDYEKRMQQNISEKELIGKKAVAYLKDGDSLFLDYGTTTYAVSDAIKHSDLKDLTVITNSVAIAHNLCTNYQIHLIVLGGNLRNSESSLSGPMALALLDSIYTGFGFFGCGGIQPDIGVTNHFFNEVEVSKKALRHSQKKIIVADHTKFNITALYKTTNVEDVDFIISDSQVTAEDRDVFKNHHTVIK